MNLLRQLSSTCMRNAWTTALHTSLLGGGATAIAQKEHFKMEATKYSISDGAPTMKWCALVSGPWSLINSSAQVSERVCSM